MLAPDDDVLLPDRARLLHIGPQKTGSTALQAAISSRRQSLLDADVTALCVDRKDRLALFTALMHHDSDDARYRDDFARWARLVDLAAAASGRVLLSHESLGKADSPGARRMVQTFGDDQVHVLAVARRLDRLLPSQWQQRVKAGATTLSYGQWLEVVLGDHPDDDVWRNVWVPHDIAALVERWSDAAAPERFTLLVADESDRRLLSRVVEQMLGLSDGLLAPDESHKSNASLSFDRLELLRAFNDRVTGGGEGQAASDKRWLREARRAIKLVEPVPGERPVPPLPAWARDRVRELSDARVELVRSLPVRVVGDPEDLRSPGLKVHETEAPVAPDLVSSELAALVLQRLTEQLRASESNAS